jgi:hypothetical protein
MPRKAPAAEVERPVGTQVESDAAPEAGSEAQTAVDGDPVEVELVEIVIEFDEDACRLRAFEISLSEEAGTAEENWLRAEQELREGRASTTEE